MTARLSLMSRAAVLLPDRDDGGGFGNFLSGDVRVPASKATMLYASGSSGGSLDSSSLVPSSVRAHFDREERRACEMVRVGVRAGAGADELELVASDRSGASSAESGAGIASTRGRSFSTR